MGTITEALDPEKADIDVMAVLFAPDKANEGEGQGEE